MTMLVIISIQVIVLLTSLPSTSTLTTDGLALLALKSAVTSDPARSLSTWSGTDPDPCHWHGVVCSSATRRVTSLSLPNKSLSGYLPSELGLLDSLTRLNLSHNNFSNLIPPKLFSSTTNLRFLDLSHNSLVGPIPAQMKSLKALAHLDLSSNSLNGSLPDSLSELRSLAGTLNLSYNAFSGEIPPSYGEFPVMVSLDLRHNNLTGKVPLVGSLVNQGPTAFSENPGLCGFPLDTLCPEAVNISGRGNPMKPNDDSTPGLFHWNEKKTREGTGLVAVPLISGVSLVIVAVSVSVWLFRRRSDKGKTGKGEKKAEAMEEEKSGDIEEGQDGKFVVLDEGFCLELEDLLRASAYVVGKSRSGIVYKVVVGEGGRARDAGVAGPTVVAVRRLSEGDATWKFKEFESEVEGIGRAQHPNIVRLKAYYYAHDEKLLVSDFVRNGSLWTALHGGSSNMLPSLSWAARLKIAQGTARGLMYIHEYSPRKYVHGNLKSTKILLDDELQPRISGFGLFRLVLSNYKFTAVASKKQYSTQTIVAARMGSAIASPANVYLAPEARVPGTKFTQKCDVYSFGVVLMELLTGRVPDSGPENDGKGLENLVRKVFQEESTLSVIIDPALLNEIHAKKQVIAMFHIALNCTELDPELRPRMRTVSESLDRIKLQ